MERAPSILAKLCMTVKPKTVPLDDVEQPENHDDQKDGSQPAGWVIAPVSRVGIARKGAKDEKQQNDNNDEHDMSPDRFCSF